MSVWRRKWRDEATGASGEYWMIGVDYALPDGRVRRVRKRSPIQTRRGAEQYEREVRVAIAAGTYGKEGRRQIPTLEKFKEEFIETYAKVYNRPAEVKSKEGIFRRYLLPVLGRRRTNEIGLSEIEGLKAKLLASGKSPKTINNAVGVLGKCLRIANERGLAPDVPKNRKLEETEPEWDFLNFEEAERLLDAAKKTPQWRVMIFTALRTGLRYGELSELRWDDVDLVSGKLLVRRSFHDGHVGPPKNGKTRELPLSFETVEYLRQHREDQSARRKVISLVEEDGELSKKRSRKLPMSPLVFTKPEGGRHIHRRADVGLKRCCKRAGLRGIGWHTLRHTFASHLVMRGASLKSVQELLGHKTIQMTMRYAHLSPEVKRDAVALLDSPDWTPQRHNDGTSGVMDR